MCDLGWLEALSFASFKGSAFGNRSRKVISAICAAMLLGFGLKFVYRCGDVLLAHGVGLGETLLTKERGMKSRFAAAVVFLMVQSALGRQAKVNDVLPPAPEGKTWKLVWHDEFDGKKLDAGKWEIPEGKRRDGDWCRKAISLDGKGHLAMSVLKEGDKFIDGCVRTKGKFEHSFGYYVARVRLQKQPGHWSAFWTLRRRRGQGRQRGP